MDKERGRVRGQRSDPAVFGQPFDRAGGKGSLGDGDSHSALGLVGFGVEEQELDPLLGEGDVGWFEAGFGVGFFG